MIYMSDVNNHRCIISTAFVLNPHEGPAYIKVPYRVGDPPISNIDWVNGFTFCPNVVK